MRLKLSSFNEIIHSAILISNSREKPAGCKSRLESFFSPSEFLSAQNDDETVGYIIPHQTSLPSAASSL